MRVPEHKLKDSTNFQTLQQQNRIIGRNKEITSSFLSKLIHIFETEATFLNAWPITEIISHSAHQNLNYNYKWYERSTDPFAHR